jgi:hypothetical protein
MGLIFTDLKSEMMSAEGTPWCVWKLDRSYLNSWTDGWHGSLHPINSGQGLWRPDEEKLVSNIGIGITTSADIFEPRSFCPHVRSTRHIRRQTTVGKKGRFSDRKDCERIHTVNDTCTPPAPRMRVAVRPHRHALVSRLSYFMRRNRIENLPVCDQGVWCDINLWRMNRL